MNTLKLTISEPCHENWQAMTPNNDGRYCDSCQKNVTDFRHMTDHEVYDVLLKGDANMCGRFSASQLDRGIEYGVRKKLKWHRYFFSVMIPTFLLAKQATAQMGLVVRKPYPPVKKEKMIIPFSEYQFDLSGQIFDEISKEPLQHGSVLIKNSRYGIGIDQGGNFKLHGSGKASFLTLLVSAIGYEAKEINIALPAEDFKMEAMKFSLKPKTVELDMVTVNSSDTHYLSGMVGGISSVVIQREITELPKRIMTLINDSIRISPNPVPRGSSFVVTLKLKEESAQTMQILDIEGRVVFQKLSTPTGKKYTETLQCGNNWSAGVYSLRIIQGGKLVGVKRFVVE